MIVILNEIFKFVLESSQPRKDGCNFSRFDSISDVMEKVHVKLINSSDKQPEQIRSNYHELDRILDVILLIWDDHFMCHSKGPRTYNDRYTYEEKPKDRSVFESIIRRIINDLFSSIDSFIDRLSRNGCDLYSECYRTNRQLIHSVLQIALQLPLEEMFEVKQTRSDLPLHISVQHNVDSFIKVYIWIILILLHNGPQFDFESVKTDEPCSICCDETKKDFVKIVDGCVHSYCKSCFSEVLKLSNKCPGCRQEYKPIDISEMCARAVSVFLEERRKRNEALIKLETDEKQILLQFLEKRRFDLTTIYTEYTIRCFADCGSIYTKELRGSHKCVDGTHHNKTKSTSLSELRPTDCCINCEGKFYAYMECGHIVCEKHLDPSKYNRVNCPKCSTYAYKFKLNL
jgi:hypothetical protein